MVKENQCTVLPANKRDFGLDTFVFLFVLVGSTIYISSVMGVGPMFKTLLNTAYSVLVETVLYICAICVIMGAVSALLTEFRVVNLAQWLINPIMKPIYNMPGAASLGIVTTFLSDNPAILSLAQDPKTCRYFKKYQLPSLCNLGTSFGRGMVVCTFMLGLGTEFVTSIVAGLFGCVIGSIISTRLMHKLTKQYYQKHHMWDEMQEFITIPEDKSGMVELKVIKKSLFNRIMDAYRRMHRRL